MAAVVACPATAAAQACCGATGLVIPGRLRVYEDVGVGVQVRERQSYGSFAANGDFATVSDGDLVTEQDLFAMWRALPRLQLGILVPFIETYRRVQALSEWGGFFGDVAANARFEIVRSGEYRHVPILTLLGGISLPTGRAPDQAHNLLGTDAAGSGSFEGTLGLEVEELWTHWFVSLDAWVTKRTSRAAPGGRQSFAPRWTGLVACGYVFTNEIATGAFASVTREGEGGTPPATSSALATTRVGIATAGLAALFPVTVGWRLQAAASADLPLPGWGQNQPATVGVNTSLVHVWP
jgi:hypothetical protein